MDVIKSHEINYILEKEKGGYNPKTEVGYFVGEKHGHIWMKGDKEADWLIEPDIERVINEHDKMEYEWKVNW